MDRRFSSAKADAGRFTISLTKLEIASSKQEGWRSTARFWKPQFELSWKGIKQDQGWKVEWTAEDRYGNQGQELALSEPVLKFTASFHPEATNLNASVLLASLPRVTKTNLQPVWWNVSAIKGGCTFTVLGIFPSGVHIFSQHGEYLTNPPVSMTAVRGGSPSGWMSTSRRVTPTRVESYFGHYTDAPVVYVKVSDLSYKEKIGLRFKDEASRLYGGEREEQGTSTGIVPFIVRIPDEAGAVTPEMVLLPPLKAEFMAKTPSIQ